MYALESAGYVHNYGQSFTVTTKSGRFAGIISERFKSGKFRVYFNGSCSKGSARRFDTLQGAVDFIHNRRIKKGYAAA